MTEIALKIANQVIQLPEPRPRLVAGSAGVYAVTLAYDAQWDDATVRVVVFDGGLCNQRVPVQDPSGTVPIPPECIAHGGRGNWLQIGVLGYDGTGALRITTRAMLDGLRIDPAGASDADVPQEPPAATPGLWEELVADVGNLSDLQTSDTSSLVAAINELAAKPGQPGADGSPGADGHTPEITASKSGKVTTIMADGTAIAEISDGADGAPGAAGADGVTPDIQIGTVTTLTAGSEATASMSGTTAAPLLNLGIPKGDKGDAGGASAADLSLGLSSATVGQTIKVKAVDTDGKPTAWEAVDMTGGGKEWKKIIEAEIAEPTIVFEAAGLDNVTELYCEWGGLKTASETNKRDLDLYINDIAVAVGWVTNAASNGQTMYGYSISTYNGFVWYNTRSPGISGASNAHNPSIGNFAKVSYGLVHGVGAATKIKIKAFNADNAPVVGKVEVWAK